MIGWVFFRAETLPAAVAFLEALGGWSTPSPTPFTVQWYLTREVALAIAAGVIGSMPWVPVLARRAERSIAMEAVATASLAALFVASIMQMAARTYNPFIYFRF